VSLWHFIYGKNDNSGFKKEMALHLQSVIQKIIKNKNPLKQLL